MKQVSEHFISTSFGLGEKPTEMYKNPEEAIKKAVGPEGRGSLTESNLWLPWAAKEYKLSPNIRDYVLVPVPVLFTDIPNTNGDSVKLKEFLRFDTNMGQQAFKTFRGKPCHLEHANKDVTKAKGVILDVFLRPLKRFGNGRYYKLVELMAYDRTKDPLLVNSILKGDNNAYSVGFYFKSCKCSICGFVAQLGQDKFCEHTRPRRPTYRDAFNRLVYRECQSIIGFETSVVASPSYISAIGPHLMDPSTM